MSELTAERTVDGGAGPSPFVFVTGCMRSGTTFIASWLASALPEPKIGLRETGVTLAAHQALSVFEYNVREHSMGYRFAADSVGRRETVLALRRAALALYDQLGWRPATALVDKQPYAYSDLESYHAHLRELFPEIRLLTTIREPYAVIGSMLRRQWGRGPWPRPQWVSPLTYRLGALENCIGDVFPEAPGEPEWASGRRSWTLEKACLHWRTAILGLARDAAHQPGLVLDYDMFEAGEGLRSAVSAHLETPLATTPSFTRPERAPDAELSRDRIEALVGAEALEAYDDLRRRAAKALGIP